ncbi:hypothetical protein LINPERPRIM_LOCUS11425 [Linum perenne]
MDVGCYLFEFASEALCDWVMQRSWHIHTTLMVIRRWFPGIQPIDFSKELKPAWIELRNVPAELITPDGISWLATQFGKPVNKFVRLGFTIKVCVLRNPKEQEVSELRLDMGDDEPAVVRVLYPSGRIYREGGGTARRWDARQKFVASTSGTSGNVPKPSAEGEGSPEAAGGTPVGGGGSDNAFKSSNEEEKTPDQQDDTEYVEEVVILSHGAQKKKKKRKKRKGKGNAQQASPAPGVGTSCNDSEVLYGMEGSPEANSGEASVGGVADNETKSSCEEEESSANQIAVETQVEIATLGPNSPVKEKTDEVVRRVVTFRDFAETSKVTSPPAKAFVLTRQQHNKRKK